MKGVLTFKVDDIGTNFVAVRQLWVAERQLFRVEQEGMLVDTKIVEQFRRRLNPLKKITSQLPERTSSWLFLYRVLVGYVAV